MSMTQTIEIDGQPVKFRASAAIPRIYRMRFHRDIYRDLSALEKSLGNQDEGSSNLDLFSLEMFENIAFIMAKHADASIPDTPEEWLDNFNTFSIYQVLPTDREMTTPLFLLRCVQLGLSIRDLDLLTIGLVNDMFIESRNDEYNGYSEIATQSDYDLF